MTDHPMLFSAPMVRALLEGRKTQIRRAIKGMTKHFDHPKMGGWEPTTFGGEGVFQFRGGKKVPVPETFGVWHQTSGASISAPVQVSDRIWVREAAAVRYTSRHHVDGHRHKVDYRADEDENGRFIGSAFSCGGGIRTGKAPSHFPKRSHRKDGNLQWCPSIHMPRWASRLTLVVTDVRAQRLQEISEEDARAEGADRLVCDGILDDDVRFYQSERGTHYTGFAGLWSHTYGADSWEANPWVWALTFDVQRRQNIDEVAA